MSDTSRERLLYIPNEGRIGDQVGPRQVFTSLLSEDRLAAYEAFALPFHVKEYGEKQAFQELIGAAERLRPTLVLWQHAGSLAVPTEVLSKLQELGVFLVYHEGDIYGEMRKRLPVGARYLARASDLTLTVGGGPQARMLRRAGAQRVGFVPSSVDLSRFGTDWVPSPNREFDVVVIGTRVSGRLPGTSGIPGARRRLRLVRGLGELLGERLAVYGHGWEGFVGERGPLPFDRQEEAARNAWLTVAWNHFDSVPYFFSNRLPISLVTGVAHLTNRQPGYEAFFEDGRELFLATSVADAIDRVGTLLEGPRVALERVAARGERFARQHLATSVVFRRMLDMAVACRKGEPLPGARQWIEQDH